MSLWAAAAYKARVEQIERTLDQDWYTVNEVAQVLDVHRKTVEGWINAGKLPYTRPSPRKTRILKSQLAAYMARNSP